MRWFRRAPAPIGQRGEDLAARHLRRKGYRILGRNLRFGRHEIDIIACKGDTTAFVEVKTRREGTAVAPEDNVGPAKRKHIIAGAHKYMAAHDEPGMYYRYDIVAVLVPETGKPSVEHIPDAFQNEPRAWR